jgi:hypothetical protein
MKTTRLIDYMSNKVWFAMLSLHPKQIIVVSL